MWSVVQLFTVQAFKQVFCFCFCFCFGGTGILTQASLEPHLQSTNWAFKYLINQPEKCNSDLPAYAF
jgi:hypothetical protein